MSHTVLTYHLVFGTRGRCRTIFMEHERELYKVIHDFAKARGCRVWRIGGMPDHVHILCDIPPTIAVSNFIKILKSETSKFMRANPHFPCWEGWAESFGAFTIDSDSRQRCLKYIMNQREHHGSRSFENEYRYLLRMAGIDENGGILGDIYQKP